MEQLPSNLLSGIASLIYLAQVVGVSFAVMAIIYSAVKMMMADGPVEARQERKSLLESILALVVIALAVPIANWLLAAFGAGIQIPRPGLPKKNGGDVKR